MIHVNSSFVYQRYV